MRRFYSQLRSRLARKSTSNRGLNAACVSLGLATAWGGEAAADVTFKLTLAPEQTLTNAVVFYGNNRTSGTLQSLGTIPGGQTTTIFQTLSPGPRGSTVATEPEYYDPALGFATPYYVVIGLHQGESGPRASVSFPNDEPIVSGLNWTETFESPTIPASLHVAEEELISDLINGHVDPRFPGRFVADAARNLAQWYGGPSFVDGRLSSPYGGHTAVFVDFGSNTSFGGTAVIELVPEPATWCLLVSMAGTFVMSRRRRDVS